MIMKRDCLVRFSLVLAMLAVLFSSISDIQAATVTIPVKPQTTVQQQVKPPLVQTPVLDPRQVLLADLSIDWIRLNKAIMEGDRVGGSVFNISVTNYGAANAPASKISMSVAALTGGPAPTGLSIAGDCPALAKGGNYAFTWPGPGQNSWMPGSYRLTVEADSSKIVRDANRANNIKTFDFTVLPRQKAKVTDSVGNPLAAAHVGVFSGSFKDNDGNPCAAAAPGCKFRAVSTVFSGTTDAKGLAYISSLPTGTYQFLATATGYDANSVTANIPGATVTLALSKSTAKGSALIAVNDVNSNPIIGATVSVTVGGAVRTTTTDGNGAASFSDLPVVASTFTASKAGYGTATTSLTIAANTITRGIIRLTGEANTVKVTVTDGSRNMSGVTVKAIAVNYSDVVKVTDSQGLAAFSNLPAKQHVFMVNHPGYTSQSVSLIVSSGVTLTQTIALAREYGNMKIVVQEASTYSRLGGATVSVTVAGAVRNMVTDSQGLASFTSLPTGNYTFTATLTGYNPGSVQTDVFRGDNALGGKAIYLGREKGSITVTVTDGTNPVDLADVTLLASNSTTRTAKTNAQGIASLDYLLTGQYQVRASKYGYDTKTAMTAISVNTMATASLALTKQPGTFNTKITTQDAFGNPLSGTTVNVKGNGVSPSQLTDAQGVTNFTNLPIGLYTITATKSGFKTFSFTTQLSASGLIITMSTP